MTAVPYVLLAAVCPNAHFFIEIQDELLEVTPTGFYQTVFIGEGVAYAVSDPADKNDNSCRTVITVSKGCKAPGVGLFPRVNATEGPSTLQRA